MNIRVDLNTPIINGTEVVFRSPVDCAAVTGLIVYYKNAGATASKEFAFADAHGNNVGDINHLFAEDAVVKVILDVTKGMAFVQNADTNSYLEEQLASKAPAGYGYGGTPTYLGQVSEADLNSVLDNFISTIEDDTPHQVTIWIEGMSVSLCTVIRGGVNWACVRGFTFAGAQGEWVKHKNNGTWLPLEWENPPLSLGEEYRTTERYNGKAVYKKLDSDGVLMYRLDGETDYKPYSQVPGDASKVVADLNTCLSNGWYLVRQASKNVPAGFDYGSVFVVDRNLAGFPEQVVQYLFAHFNSAIDGSPTAHCQMIRHTTDGGKKWTTYWVNPPLEPNIEYLTIEKYNGKAVYAQCVYFGSLPVSGEKSVEFTNTLITRLINMQAIVHAPIINEWYDLNNLAIVDTKPYVLGDTIFVNTSGDFGWDNDVYIYLKYTKY